MRKIVLLFTFVALSAQPTSAELKPDEIAIIAVRNSKPSHELAAYYADKRGIPSGHICHIDVEPNKDLDRERWELVVKPAIRDWLLHHRLEGQVRCLVTMWDLPLKIGRTPSQNSRARQVFLESVRSIRTRRAFEFIDEVHRIGSAAEVAPRKNVDTATDVKQLSDELESAINLAKRRTTAITDASQAGVARVELLKVIAATGGLRLVNQMMSQQTAPTPAAEIALGKERARVQGRLQGLQEGIAALEQLPDSPEREEQILTLAEAVGGVIGSIAWIDERLTQLKRNETYASFDSELSLLFWPPYPLDRWQPNLLHYRYDGSPARDRRLTLMVSRLEAPTVRLTKLLIDNAIEAEREGVEGKVYLDARGIRGNEVSARGSYGEYDQALHDLAGVLKDHSRLQVVLDNEGALFQPGSCPNAALYCGWYSLANYVDAFDFNRGAVGYHIASSEATTLRNPDSQVWCKRLLDDGVCATLGPVHEPYLAAFPRPDEFFISLLSGRFSLVECYYRTKPFNSWVMVLVGDPLYNPYRKAPAVQSKHLPENFQRLLLD